MLSKPPMRFEKNNSPKWFRRDNRTCRKNMAPNIIEIRALTTRNIFTVLVRFVKIRQLRLNSHMDLTMSIAQTSKDDGL